MTRSWSVLSLPSGHPAPRLVGAFAVGLALVGLLWVAFTSAFPLAEFCSRNRPTWVIPIFERASYTALSGEWFLLVVATAVGLYLTALRLAIGLRGRFAAAVLLVLVPVALTVVLLPSYPLLSSDIFKYIFGGRILAVYGENPFTHVPAEFPQDRFYDLVYWKAVANAHGPLWRLAEATSATVGGESCRDAVLAMKAWPAAAYLGTTLAVYLLIRACQPERAIWGTLVYAWNPLVALEALQNGHNDVVAALPAVVAVWLTYRNRYGWAFPLLAISALIKPLAVVLGPLLLIAALRAPDRRARGVIRGVAVGASLVLMAYLPFWEGLDTFQGLSRAHIFSTSPAAALLDLLVWAGMSADDALIVAATMSNGLFAFLTVPLLWSAWTGRLTLTSATFGLLFLYCLVASQWFNPWYLLWLMPFAALVRYRAPRVLGVAFSVLAPVVYAGPYTIPATLVAFVPMTVLAVWWRGWLGWGSPRPSHRLGNEGHDRAGHPDEDEGGAGAPFACGDAPQPMVSTLRLPGGRARR